MNPPNETYTLPEQMQREVCDFIEYLENTARLSYASIRTMMYPIVKMLRYCNEKHGMQSFEEFEFSYFMEWSSTLERTKPSTHNLKLTSIGQFVKYCALMDFVSYDYIAKMDAIRRPRRYANASAVAFSNEEIATVFANIDKRFPYSQMHVDKINRGLHTHRRKTMRSLMNVQMKSLVWLLLETGLRIHEAWNLTVDDVDPASDSISVVGKGEKPRIVPYSEVAKIHMRKWLAHRRLLVQDNRSELWIRNVGIPVGQPVGLHAFKCWIYPVAGLSRKTKYRNEHDLAMQANWHKFRKTFATRSYESGMDLGVL
jgi:site-specific recombinase XerD